MTPGHQHRELDSAGATQVHQGIHRRARCAAVVDHVVDENDDLAADVRHLAVAPLAVGRPEMKVVAVQGHVEPAKRHRVLLELGEDLGEASGKDVALADYAHEHYVLDPAVALDDLMRDAREGAADLIRIHHGGLEPAFGDAHAGPVTTAACRAGPYGYSGRCVPAGSRPPVGPRPPRARSRLRAVAGA